MVVECASPAVSSVQVASEVQRDAGVIELLSDGDVGVVQKLADSVNGYAALQ